MRAARKKFWFSVPARLPFGNQHQGPVFGLIVRVSTSQPAFAEPLLILRWTEDGAAWYFCPRTLNDLFLINIPA
jgi:hypothetical protein